MYVIYIYIYVNGLFVEEPGALWLFEAQLYSAGPFTTPCHCASCDLQLPHYPTTPHAGKWRENDREKSQVLWEFTLAGHTLQGSHFNIQDLR